MYSSLHRRNRILKIVSTAKFCTLRFGFLKLTTKTPKYKKLPCGSFFYWGGRWGYAVSNSSSQRHLNSPRSLPLPLLVKMFRCFAVKKHPPGCFFILSSSEFSPISRLNTKNSLAGVFSTGADDEARTHDNRYHKPGLYQLSYVRRWLLPFTNIHPKSQ